MTIGPTKESTVPKTTARTPATTNATAALDLLMAMVCQRQPGVERLRPGEACVMSGERDGGAESANRERARRRFGIKRFSVRATVRAPAATSAPLIDAVDRLPLSLGFIARGATPPQIRGFWEL